MSVVIAIKEKDKVIIGCDDRESCGNLYYDSFSAKRKVRIVKPGLIIGCAGNLLVMDVIAEQLKTMTVINEETIREMLLDICTKYHNTPVITDDYRIDGEVIIAYKNRAYLIAPNLIVINIDDYRAIGSGTEVAMGSLYTSENLILNDYKRMYVAIYAVGANVSSVSKNVYMTDTIENSFHLMELK